MPTKLIVLMALMGLNVAVNLATGSYVAGVLGALVLLGVIAGNEAVRKLVIAINVLALVFTGVLGTIGLLATGFAPIVLVSYVVSLGSSIFAIWCLTRSDVEHWMYKRSMKGAAD